MTRCCIAWVCLWCAVGTAAWAAEPDEREATFRARAQPLLVQYCFDCHGNGTAEGDLALDRFQSARQVLRGREQWVKVLQKLSVKAMPPADGEQPTDAERAFLIEWIDDTINNFDCVREARPGRVTIRRLNRNEYRNTIRELVGIDYQPAEDFPADDVGYGFDNIGDVLSLPPILMEKYLDAAEAIAAQAIDTRGPTLPLVARTKGVDLQGNGRAYRRDTGSAILVSTGTMSAGFKVDKADKYEVRIEAFGHQAGGEAVRMGLSVDGRQDEVFEVQATEREPGVYTAEFRAGAGEHRVAVAFLNDYYKPDAPDPAQRDRNLIVTAMEVRGPLSQPRQLPASHRLIMFVTPGEELSEQEAARQILQRLASRAFRRPAAPQEVERLVKLAESARKAGDGFAESIQLAMQAILVSPNFLFRVEEDPPAGQAERLLSDYELATRLSYFLWSSMPDDELFQHAWQGSLRQDDNLQRQVRRMLADPRSRALVDNFASQWLNLRVFDEMQPSPRHFPAFTDRLRKDMRRETMAYFWHILREDRSVLELLSSDYTFVNERLARHYGIADVAGEEFRKVSLSGSPRGGLLTQASILTLTSNSTRTSPVKRGKWILENLLGEPPPPPPPDVPELEAEGRQLTGTLRQQLVQHRESASCAVCHQQMDELGFALENFDAIGGWRLFDGSHEVDAAAELPSGEKFNGPKELARVLRDSKKEQFLRCLTEKMLTYALGRGLEYYDRCAVDKITQALAEDDYRMTRLVLEIVNSEPFQKRGAKETEEDRE